MASRELQAVIEQAERLSPEEQQQLVAYLVEKTQQVTQTERPLVTWQDLAGAWPYGLFGEDAQATITRERREEDEHRAAAVKR